MAQSAALQVEPADQVKVTPWKTQALESHQEISAPVPECEGGESKIRLAQKWPQATRSETLLCGTGGGCCVGGEWYSHRLQRLPPLESQR